MTDLLIYASFTALALVFLRAIWLSARFLIIIALAMVVAANADAWIAAALPWRDYVYWWFGGNIIPFLFGFGGAAFFGALFWRTAKRNLIWKLYHEDEEGARRKRNARLEQV